MPDFPYRIIPKKLCFPYVIVEKKKSPLESCIPNVSLFGFIIYKAKHL